MHAEHDQDISLTFSRSLEYGIVGAMLLDLDSLAKVTAEVKPEWFSLPQCRSAYTLILASFESTGAVPDVRDLNVEIERDPNVGVTRYDLLEMVTYATPNVANAVDVLHVDYWRRSLAKMLANATRKLANPYQDAVDVYDALEASAASLFQDALSGHTSTHSKLVERVLGEESRQKGVLTGFHDLDRKLGGLFPRELSIIAARPSMGKTAFLTSLAMNISRQGTPVGVFSLEMAAEALVMRTLTGKAGVEMMRFRTGSTTENENAKVFASADESYSLPIYYDDFSQQSVGRIRSVCRQWQRNHGVKVVFIDYLQLITPDLLRSSDNREREVAKISSGLKGLAKDLGIHVAALAQLSRKNETRADKRPVPSDLRDSGAIEQDADLILMLHRPEEFPGSTTLSGKHPQGIAEILISKHRNGPTGSVELYFDKQSMEFRNMYREPEYDEPQNVF